MSLPSLNKVITYLLKNMVHRLEIENINNHANWCAQTAGGDDGGNFGNL